MGRSKLELTFESIGWSKVKDMSFSDLSEQFRQLAEDETSLFDLVSLYDKLYPIFSNIKKKTDLEKFILNCIINNSIREDLPFICKQYLSLRDFILQVIKLQLITLDLGGRLIDWGMLLNYLPEYDHARKIALKAAISIESSS
jgi:hypothetical protein